MLFPAKGSLNCNITCTNMVYKQCYTMGWYLYLATLPFY